MKILCVVLLLAGCGVGDPNAQPMETHCQENCAR